MANLSNINNKFLVTTTGEVLVSETGAAGAGKLWVKNDSSSYTRIANFYNTTDNSIPYITVGNQAAEGADSCVVFAFADSTTDANKFGWIGMAGDGVGTGIHWKRGGNVGIGTSSPQVPLQIGTHLTTAPADTGLCVSNRKSIRINDADGSYDFGVYMKQNYSGSSYLILGTRHGAVDTDALFVKSGKVGIGTASPTSPLYILSAAINTNTVFIQNTAATGTNYGLEIKAGTNSTDHALQVLNSSGGSLLRVRGDGNVGIGTTTPLSPLTVHGQQRWYTTNNDGNELRGFFNPGGAADPAELSLYQANGTSVGVELRATGTSYFVGGAVGIGDSTPNSGGLLDVVGGLISNGYNSNGRSTFDGSTNSDLTITVNQGQANVQPRIWFQGSNSGATPTVYAKMDVDGFYPPNGIFLGGTGSANLLDDYDEGTWTPSVAGGGGVATYTSNFGHYTKIGRQVTLQYFIAFQKNTISSTVQMGGLPFTVASYSPATNYPQGCVMLDGLAIATNNIVFQCSNGTTAGDLIGGNGGTTSHAGLSASVLSATGTMNFRGIIIYFTS